MNKHEIEGKVVYPIPIKKDAYEGTDVFVSEKPDVFVSEKQNSKFLKNLFKCNILLIMLSFKFVLIGMYMFNLQSIFYLSKYI